LSTTVEVVRLDRFRWKIPIGSRKGMRVPGMVYADEVLMKRIVADNTLLQVANAAHLPGITKHSLAMPDAHWGYGLPIGGVVATDVGEGVVSPGAVGYDINCGVRLVRTDLEKAEVEPVLEQLVDELFRTVPCGVGSAGKIRLSRKDCHQVLIQGSAWAVKNGYGLKGDLERTEQLGCLEGADPASVSERAKSRGGSQLGTLGSGNHFLEVQMVEQIYDEGVAARFGLFAGQITVMIHSGSRGLGHQVCDDYLRTMSRAVRKYGIKLPDRQLACAPVSSPEGTSYLGAMAGAANFAWANRQCLLHLVRESFERVFRKSSTVLGMQMVFDVAHNIAKIEDHEVDGSERRLCVHRKGATRAFPAGHPSLPEVYRDVGQPVLIPGDMGTASYVLVGTELTMQETFGSTCHGAGRQMSRHEAVRTTGSRPIQRELAEKGILVRYRGKRTLHEEVPEAYKDVDRVVDTVAGAGLSRKVARLVPLAVVKG